MVELVSFYLLDPFAYGFMRRALVAAILVGAVCALLSCYLVLKGWALMGDAVSHAVLPGIVLAWMAGLPLALGAFAAGMGCALLTGYIKDHSRVKEDTVMGIVFAGMFAAGLVMLSRIETDIHLMHILFGNILGVGWGDIAEILALSGVTIAVVFLKWRDFMIYVFDPAYAKVAGLPVRALHFSLLVLLALSIVASLKAVGIILVIALLIAPGATAFLISHDFRRMMILAVLMAVFCCVAGLVISFHADIATAPVIVLLQAGLFAAAFGCNLLREEKSGIWHAKKTKTG